MKKRLTALILVMVMIASLTACSSSAKKAEQASSEAAMTEQVSSEAEAAESGDVDAQISDILEKMTPEQKLSQMMVVALRSDADNTKTAETINQDYTDILQKYDFGGIILFGGNIVDTAQTVTLIRDCQTAAAASEQGIPMLVCVDQEGGLVNRVSFGTTSSGNMGLAATGETALTEESADMLGQEIKALGFNMDFAPVSDVNSNPNNPIIGVRSFSDDPELVAEHVTAFIKGLKKNGIASALKHFPGHGNVGEVSHTHLPASEFTLEEIKDCDLVPFQAGIEEGTDMIMTAHIQYPNIETDTYVSVQDGEKVYLPATLSHKIITGILRDEMGYDGIVITDSMVMDAIAAHFDPIDAATMAINAGVDILLCPVDLYKDAETDTFPNMDKYMQGLLARIDSGEIKEEELDDSVARILKLKIENGIFEDASQERTLDEQIASAEAVVGSSEHHAREWEIAQAGMTLLKNEDGMLPLDGKNGDHTLILYPSEYRQESVDYSVSRLGKEGLLDAANVTSVNYAELTADDEGLQKALAEADHVLLLSQSTDKNAEIVKVIDQIKQEGKADVALVSLNLPYDAACYPPDVDAVICAYQPYGSAHDADGNGPFNLNVAVVLCASFGQSVPQGILPVNVPQISETEEGIVYTDENLYERGSGLKDWEK